MCPELIFKDANDLDINEADVRSANALLNQTFGFYGGYCQLAANAKE